MRTRLELLQRIGKDVREARIVGVAVPELRERMCRTMAELVKLACETVESPEVKL